MGCHLASLPITKLDVILFTDMCLRDQRIDGYTIFFPIPIEKKASFTEYFMKYGLNKRFVFCFRGV